MEEIYCRSFARDAFFGGLGNLSPGESIMASLNRRIVCIVAAAFLLLGLSQKASAQELSDDFLWNHLYPADLELVGSGLDPNDPANLPAIIGIYERYGVPVDISSDEARAIIQASKELRSGVGKFAIAFQKLAECAETRAKGQAAKKLSRTLTGLAWLNSAAAGMMLATGVGAPMAAPFGFSAALLSIASTAAGWMAADYGSMACTKGDILWTPSRMIQTWADPVLQFAPRGRWESLPCLRQQFGA
jgi:hypothetical protein